LIAAGIVSVPATQVDLGNGAWRIIATIMAVTIAGVASSAVIYAATPLYIKVFPDPQIIGLLSSLYFLVGSVSAGLCGGIGDLYGRRTTLAWVLAIVALGGTIGASIGHPYVVVVAHAVQGVGIAVPTLCLGLLREHVPAPRLPFAVALVATASTGTAGFFFFLAGFIMDHYSWRWTFIVGLLFLVPAISLLLTFIPHTARTARPSKVPAVNGLMFGLSSLCLLLATGKAGESGLFAVDTLCLFALGLLVLYAWVRQSLRIETPMVDVRLLLRPGLAATIAAYGLLSVGVNQFPQVLIYVGRATPAAGIGGGLSSTLASAMLVPFSILSLVGGPLAGLAAARYGRRVVFLTGMALVAVPWAMLALLHHSHMTLSVIAIVAGFIYGGSSPAFRIALVGESPPSRTSSAMGIAEVLRAFSMGIGAQLVAMLMLGNHAKPERMSIAPGNFHLLLALVFVTLAGAFGIYQLFGGREQKFRES